MSDQRDGADESRTTDEAVVRLTAEVRALRVEVSALGQHLNRLVGGTESADVVGTASGLIDEDDSDFEFMPIRERLALGRTRIQGAFVSGAHHHIQRIRTASRRFKPDPSRTEWTPPRPLLWDAITLITIGIAAFLLRYIDLLSIPPGLHGDEATTGLAAREIIDHGWIGVYSGRSGGVPAGNFYLAVPFIKWISDPVLAVRTLSAVGGTIAVLATYILARRNLGFVSAVISASLLAVSEWALQFSRTGFTTSNWLPFALVGAVFLMEAIRTHKWWWWIAAGLTLPSGIYIANGHTQVLLLMLPFAALGVVGWRFTAAVCLFGSLLLWPSNLTIAFGLIGFVLGATDLRLRQWRSWRDVLAFTIPALAVSRGMIKFAQANHEQYFGRTRDASVFRTDAWHTQIGLWDQAIFLLKRYWQFWQLVTFKPHPSGADLSGITSQIPGAMFWLALFGLVAALALRPNWLVIFATVMVLLAPLGSVLLDNVTRRSFIIIPFVCLLIGVGSYEIVRLGFRRTRRSGLIATAVVSLLMIRVVQENYSDFFDTTQHSPATAYIFGADYRDTMDYMATLDDSDYVIFLCDRWSIRYESGQLIAPDVRGEDRLPKWGGPGGYAIDPTQGSPIFVLMGEHLTEIGPIQSMYPGGTMVTGPTLPNATDPSYIAYLVPAGSAVEAGQSASGAQ